jgi:hypothetical protein
MDWEGALEHWTHLAECSPWNPCLLDMYALDSEMCHLGLECFTCGPIYCLVRLLVVDKATL